jgi:type IV pilus assembly protein PilO
VNLQLSKKHLMIIFLSILLLGGAVAGAYYLLILPVHEQLDRKETELKLASQELTIIENKLADTSEKTILSTMELQKQVPVKRMLDQLLLDLEKAEVISDTNIIELKLDGTEDDEEIDLVAEAAKEEDPGQEEDTSGDQNDGGESTGEAVTPVEEILPNGIRKISMTLSGEAATYFEMEKFIKSLESLKRIVKVEVLNFTGLPEIYSVDQDSEKVEFEVSLAAYYYPNLEELQKELPPLDVPAVSNKQNPLSGFSSQEGVEGEGNTQP